MSTQGPPGKARGGAPIRNPASDAKTEEIEHPFGSVPPVNGDTAWDADKPVEAVPFDWAAVERNVDGYREQSDEVDFAKRYLGISAYLRDMAELAPQPGRLPTLQQSACNWLASSYVLQLPFVEGKTLRECAAAVGVSHEYFRRFVAYWAEKLRLPIPFAKPPETGLKIAAKLSGRNRKKFRGAVAA